MQLRRGLASRKENISVTNRKISQYETGSLKVSTVEWNTYHPDFWQTCFTCTCNVNHWGWEVGVDYGCALCYISITLKIKHTFYLFHRKLINNAEKGKTLRVNTLVYLVLA